MRSTTLKYHEVKKYMNVQGYEILQDYVEGWSKKIKMKCPNDHIIEMTWGNFKTNNRRCKFCSIKNRSTSKEDIINRLSKEGYELIEELGKVNSKYRKIKVKCDKGHIYDVELRRFNEGRRCPTCSDTTFGFNYVKSFVEDNGYTLISNKYVNVYQKLEMICPKGHTYYSNFHNFKNSGSRCPRCFQSKGENFISEILNKNNVKFIREHTFKDCKHIKLLPFDFYLPEFNILIEYDGEQHFSLKHSFSEESFVSTQRNDNIKNQYCKDNNIKLVRIPYWEFDNIENILEKELKLNRENFND